MAPAKFQLANLITIKDSYWFLLEMPPDKFFWASEKHFKLNMTKSELVFSNKFSPPLVNGAATHLHKPEPGKHLTPSSSWDGEDPTVLAHSLPPYPLPAFCLGKL